MYTEWNHFSSLLLLLSSSKPAAVTQEYCKALFIDFLAPSSTLQLILTMTFPRLSAALRINQSPHLSLQSFAPPTSLLSFRPPLSCSGHAGLLVVMERHLPLPACPSPPALGTTGNSTFATTAAWNIPLPLARGIFLVIQVLVQPSSLHRSDPFKLDCLVAVTSLSSPSPSHA